jgi:triacylglycerol lipase
MAFNLREGARLFQRTIVEVGASIVALNLYPLGIFEFDTAARKHSRLAINPRPVLFVHGAIHNWSAFVTLKRRLTKQNWENLYTLNYGTVNSNVLQMVDALGEKVDQIMGETGSSQIDIVAHSLGGIVARTFMTLGEGRGKINTLVTLGTPHQGTNLSFFAKGFSRGALDKDLKANSFLIRLLHKTTLPKSSKIVSVYSSFDWTVRPANNAKAAGMPESAFKNVKLDYIGHAGLLFSDVSFDAVTAAILGV